MGDEEWSAPLYPAWTAGLDNCKYVLAECPPKIVTNKNYFIAIAVVERVQQERKCAQLARVMLSQIQFEAE